MSASGARRSERLNFIHACVLAGTVASLAMMPVGGAFRLLGLRVGFYGPKFAGLYLESAGPVALFVQHLALGWLSVLPLALILRRSLPGRYAVTSGLIFGAAYYVLVNSLVLPWYFGDPSPWALGFSTVTPSLIVHLVVGASAAWVLRRFDGDREAASE